jgi:hypothetical protein
MTTSKLFKNIKAQGRCPLPIDTLLEWFVLGFFGLLIFSSYMYRDFSETMRHGMIVWDALFDGRLLDFYAYCGGNSTGVVCGSTAFSTVMDARYDFTIYVIFAIWNLPLWIIEHFRGGNIQDSFVAMLYAKSMLLVAVGITGYLVKKITALITASEDKCMPGLLLSYCSSCTLMASILMIGQYDILSLIFILAGVYYYLKEENKKFLLCFALAVSMKYFALLYMLPLLCLKDKNPLKIIGKLALSLSITAALKLLFMLGTYGSSVIATNNGLIDILSDYKIFSGVSMFWASYLILVIHCYQSQNPSPSRHYQETIFAGFSTYILMYVAAPAYPYWIVLAIPFLTILIHTSGNKYGLNTFLCVIFEAALLVSLYTRYSWCYSREAYGNMLLYRLFPLSPEQSVATLTLNKGTSSLPDIGTFIVNFSTSHPTLYLTQMLSTAFTAVGYALILINVPKEHGLVHLDYNHRSLYIRLRMLVCIAVALIPAIYYIMVALTPVIAQP